MYYEINVALNGRHFFATAERSITDRDKLDEVYAKFKTVFPESKGYSLYVSRRETVGYKMVEGAFGSLRMQNEPD